MRKTEDQAQVIVLGSGTSVPNGRRRPPAYCVVAGDSKVLLDCGAGATTALASHGIGLEELSAVFLTHFHPDHTAELVPLLFALKNPAGPRRSEPLPIYGPAGLQTHIAALRGVYGRWVEPTIDGGGAPAVSYVELEEGSTQMVGAALAFRPFAVVHSERSVAYRVGVVTADEGPGKVICFSGDSGPCKGLTEAARDADLFVCECAATLGQGLSGHLDAHEVAETARAAGCRRVVLTHLYDHVEAQGPAWRVRESLADVACEVLLAADDLVIAV
jgi:ribonuclease BN (tRNA processing enzyme)